VEFDVEKTIPVHKKIKRGYCYPEAFRYQTAFRWQYDFREKLCRKMREVDRNINAFGIRALTAEIISFIDGEHTISEIADYVGYEYGFKIKSEHVLNFLLQAKEQGHIHFKIKKITIHTRDPPRTHVEL